MSGRSPSMSRRFERSRQRTSTLEAICLHEYVAPERWCVTKADLRYLQHEVNNAIKEGKLSSSFDSEDSDSLDEPVFGPSIYVVNEQYIKPVTAQAGKMSWALMLNPDGLDCHLFVSHAWQEGIFEFLSKVLTSWPSRAHNAWCCMLANPQNLNIGSMLQSPKTSPFALALQASRYVLVVPNRHQSVYSRLWCGYEAYVASEDAKIIQIARASTRPLMFWTLTRATALLALGFLIGLQIREEAQQLRRLRDDMQNIWDEIGDKVPEVDHAIFVLISAGISSPSLRMAADQGVKIEGAGHAEMAVTIVVLGPLLFMSIAEMVGLCYNLLHRGLIKWEIVLLVSTVVGFVVRISFVILFCVVPVDERMFLLKVALLCLPLALLFGIAAQYDASESIHALGIISMKLVLSKVIMCFPRFQGKARIPFRVTSEERDEMMEMLQSGRMSINVERRVEVFCALMQEGQIISSGSSDSEDSDESPYEDKFGPSIYVVNEMYIKPVTAQAGKMSWALMRNPEGLDCDVFVSHAWQEGIFEFLSKVLTSWPSRAHNAWCCMLANPQNLNIGSMLQSPKTSPFALALQASRYVLVVPNRHQSVYCRLWCGYEAYVASENEKIIQIATAPSWGPMVWTLMSSMMPILLGLTIGTIAPSQAWHLKLEAAVVAGIAAMISTCTRSNWRLIANYVGLVAFASLESLGNPFRVHFQNIPDTMETFVHHLYWASALSFFVVAECDRVRSNQIEDEGRQLRKKYKGSIQFASCSEPNDLRNIWDELGDQVHEVDNAINVLISAGVSSPSLRRAAELGVKIEGAGHAEVAVAVVVLGPFHFLSGRHIYSIGTCCGGHEPLFQGEIVDRTEDCFSVFSLDLVRHLLFRFAGHPGHFEAARWPLHVALHPGKTRYF
ncbi:Uncharacterized protein SCF082_LOCUS1720 [Durusdinium trenchii]|uniref:Uncharacterized protein n=1 Tax=Durusdinium trenchii TaxID=1381693 RepID=A0ABP0HI85_9DINO